MAVLGVIDLYWNGSIVKIEKGATVKLGGMINEPVESTRDVDASQVFKASEVSATAVIPKGMSVTGTFGTAEGELQVQCDTGQSFSWAKAFRTGTLDFTGDQGGKLKLTFNAGTPSET